MNFFKDELLKRFTHTCMAHADSVAAGPYSTDALAPDVASSAERSPRSAT